MKAMLLVLCVLPLIAARPPEAPRTAPAPPAGETRGVDYLVLHAEDFQSFVGNWEGDAPLCGLIGSQADWDRYMHGAAVMGPQHRPFAPPASLWQGHVAFFLARVARNPSGQPHSRLSIDRVERAQRSLTVRTNFSQASETGGYQSKEAVFVVVPRPAPATLTFSDRDGTICTVRGR